MKYTVVRNLILSSLLIVGLARAGTVDDLLSEYAGQGAGPFNASAGGALWSREFPSKDGSKRACTSSMNKTLISLLVAGVVGTAAVGLIASEYEEEHAYREREHPGEWDYDDTDRHEHRGGAGVAYLSDTGYALYKTECGDCHMAYPPTMLPAPSWQEMMRSLDDHLMRLFLPLLTPLLLTAPTGHGCAQRRDPGRRGGRLRCVCF